MFSLPEGIIHIFLSMVLSTIFQPMFSLDSLPRGWTTTNDQRPRFDHARLLSPMVPWWMSSEIRTSSHQWRLWSSIRIHHVIYIIMIYHDISIIIIHPQSSQTYHVFFLNIDFENNPNLSWKRIFQPLSGRVPLLFYQMVLCPYISSTGWWLTYPLKNMSSSNGSIIPKYMEN